MNKNSLHQMRILWPCDEGIEWFEKQRNMTQAWESCHKGTWMLWLLNKLWIRKYNWDTPGWERLRDEIDLAAMKVEDRRYGGTSERYWEHKLARLIRDQYSLRQVFAGFEAASQGEFDLLNRIHGNYPLGR